jgi:hypothetical protein
MYVRLFYNTTNFNLQLHWLYTYTLYVQRYTQGVSMFLYYNYTQRAYSKPWTRNMRVQSLKCLLLV